MKGLEQRIAHIDKSACQNARCELRSRGPRSVEEENCKAKTTRGKSEPKRTSDVSTGGDVLQLRPPLHAVQVLPRLDVGVAPHFHLLASNPDSVPSSQTVSRSAGVRFSSLSLSTSQCCACCSFRSHVYRCGHRWLMAGLGSCAQKGVDATDIADIIRSEIKYKKPHNLFSESGFVLSLCVRGAWPSNLCEG